MKGAIEWFARNSVASNLLMLFIVVAGIGAIFRLPVEFFPEISLDMVTVRVPYRGATPAEAEEAVVLRIEEALRGLEGIDEIISTASEGSGSVTLSVAKGYEPREVLDDIKNRVDAINTFPDETEKPRVSLAQRSSRVMTVLVAGDLTEKELHTLGERVRDDILALPLISQAKLTGVRDYEIAIEVSENTLRRFGLTLEAVARAIRLSSVDMPAGAIKTRSGDVLLRTKGQAYVKEDFEKIVLIRRDDGTRLTVGDIAEVKDAFEETPLRVRFNGKSAVMVKVDRVGNQNALAISEAVKEFLEESRPQMPEGVDLAIWRDAAKIIRSRLNTLTDSALSGGILIFLLLTLFLRFSVAVWVTVGIPVAFLGAIACLPLLGISINIISLFAFILVLGIVVDDAIVTGESIYTHLKKGQGGVEAAIAGTHEVAVPVTFGVLTTAVAFLPLLFLPGFRGKMFFQIGAVVIPVLMFSIIESKFILPAHLKHLRVRNRKPGELNAFVRLQRRFAGGLETFVDRVYRPVLEFSLRNRYLTLAVFIAILVGLVSLVTSNRIRFYPMPKVLRDSVTVTLVMPVGSRIELTRRHIDRIEDAANRLKDKHTDPESGESPITSILSMAGGTGFGRGGGGGGRSHLGEVSLRLLPKDERKIDISTMQVAMALRKEIGTIAGARELSFRAHIGHGSDPIDVQLTGLDFDELARFAERIKEKLKDYKGVFDITDDLDEGKQEIQLSIKPEAELLGLNQVDLARQARQAFFGEEAQRIQRGRDDVRVMVRYPQSERRSLYDLKNMRIRTEDGTEVPFGAVADLKIGRSYSSIKRTDRQRTLHVKADVDEKSADLTAIKRDLAADLGEIAAGFPRVRWSFEGAAKEDRESAQAMQWSILGVLFAIYALLAIPFRSYVQPLMVISVIPFGVAGAIVGHLVMDLNLSWMSIFGILALAGVVVNDSLVLVDYINRRRREGVPLEESVRIAGGARFRAIILTSLTTFAGLMPLIFETSVQAQFLIPMAVSLGFGILFATAVTLLLVPANYLILEDILRGVRRLFGVSEAKEFSAH